MITKITKTTKFASFCVLQIFVGVSLCITPVHAETFRLRLTAEPETLDWNRAQTTVETHLLMNLMEGLVGFDEDFKLEPALAERWTRSPNGRTYRFYLRSGVTWSDGVPLKAQHFVDSWKRLLDPKTAAAYAYLLFDVEGAEAFHQGKLTDPKQLGFQALTDQILEVRLARTVAHWIQLPSFWVLYPIRVDLIKKFGNQWTRPDKLVTLGAFTLAEHVLESRIELKKNPRYWRTNVSGNIDTVVGLILRDDATALNLYTTGTIDFLTDLSTLDLKSFAGKTDLKTFPYLKTSYLGLVTTRPPLNNRFIRRAIAQAINKSRISNILYGGQKPAGSFVPPPLMGSDPGLGLKFDPKAAKREWNQAPKTLRETPISILVTSGEKQLTLAQYVQGELKKNLGAKVALEVFDHKTFRARLSQAEFPMFLLSWSADYPDADNFLSIFLSDAGNNRFKWRSPEFDAEVLRARSTLNDGERAGLYQSAQRRLLEQDAVSVPLFYEPNMALLRGCVEGLRLSPLNGLELRSVRKVNCK